MKQRQFMMQMKQRYLEQLDNYFGTIREVYYQEGETMVYDAPQFSTPIQQYGYAYHTTDEAATYDMAAVEQVAVDTPKPRPKPKKPTLVIPQLYFSHASAGHPLRHNYQHDKWEEKRVRSVALNRKVIGVIELRPHPRFRLIGNHSEVLKGIEVIALNTFLHLLATKYPKVKVVI